MKANSIEGLLISCLPLNSLIVLFKELCQMFSESQEISEESLNKLVFDDAINVRQNLQRYKRRMYLFKMVDNWF